MLWARGDARWVQLAGALPAWARVAWSGRRTLWVSHQSTLGRPVSPAALSTCVGLTCAHQRAHTHRALFEAAAGAARQLPRARGQRTLPRCDLPACSRAIPAHSMRCLAHAERCESCLKQAHPRWPNRSAERRACRTTPRHRTTANCIQSSISGARWAAGSRAGARTRGAELHIPRHPGQNTRRGALLWHVLARTPQAWKERECCTGSAGAAAERRPLTDATRRASGAAPRLPPGPPVRLAARCVWCLSMPRGCSLTRSISATTAARSSRRALANSNDSPCCLSSSPSSPPIQPDLPNTRKRGCAAPLLPFAPFAVPVILVRARGRMHLLLLLKGCSRLMQQGLCVLRQSSIVRAGQQGRGSRRAPLRMGGRAGLCSQCAVT